MKKVSGPRKTPNGNTELQPGTNYPRLRFYVFGTEQQRQHSKISLWTGAPREAMWKTVGKVIFSLFDLKNRFEVFHRPTNIAGGRLDILFHFPNDWYKNIEG